MEPNMSKQYVVSACLAGESCRYDGGCSPCPAVQALVRTGQALPAAVVQARERVEEDAAVMFTLPGSQVAAGKQVLVLEALQLALENGCTAAILKARSPSCGSGEIYDGSFTGTRVPGEGVFARMARKAGLEIWSEETFTEGR